MSEFGKVSTIYGIRDLILPALILSHAPDDLTKLLTLSSRDLAMCAVNLKRAQLRHCNVLPMMLVMHMTAALGQPLTFEIRNTRLDLLAGHHTAGLHLLWLGCASDVFGRSVMAISCMVSQGLDCQGLARPLCTRFILEKQPGP